MKIFLFLVFLMVQASTQAKVSNLAVAQERTGSTQEHWHIDLDSHDEELNHHSHDDSDMSHDVTEAVPHQHTHRHSPNEPEHSHSHQHSVSHNHTCQFVSGLVFYLPTYPKTSLKFALLNDRAIQGPFLDSVFRPPIV